MLAVSFFVWALFAPQAPAIAGAWWASVSRFVATGEWSTPLPVATSDPSPSSAGDAALTGRASIVDADTFDIRGTRIRLHAIDAPESSQPCFVAGDALRCGQRAALALADWIAQRTVSCIGRDIDRYGRTVATCTVGGDDIGRWLVRNGHAVAYRRYGDDYVCDEAIAATTGRGIWATIFVEPSAWRRLSEDEQRAMPDAGYDPGWPGSCS